MLACLLVLALVRAAPVQQASLGLQVRGPAVYRLEGYLDEAPPGETVYFRTVIGFGPLRRNYLITRYSRQGDGDPFEIFRNLGMYNPDFVLLGPPEPLDELMQAKAGSRVSGTFVYRYGMHVLEVDAHDLTIE